MAIYHFSVQVISRSQGRSSVAASAYRSAEKLIDDQTGIIHDYRKKDDVIKSDILLPKNAPQHLKDREMLWNEVEKVERRKDAQLAREINIALPRELSDTKNWELLTSFVQETFVDKGMIADVSFHRGHQVKGEEQPHGHVMLSLREVTEDGFGKKVREWNDKQFLKDWREQWAEHCNLALLKEGHDLQIDHRTLEAQGINLEAQSKIGPKEAQSRLARLEEHQEIARRNGERLLEAPDIALEAITQQQSTFTPRDLARFVHRHTVDETQFKAVYARVKHHQEVFLLGRDDEGYERFSTRSMLMLERTMIEQAEKRANRNHFGLASEFVEQAMAKRTLSDEQSQALRYITGDAGLACLTGFAGSGKSYLLGAAREAWEARGHRVLGLALSGIAAENLQASAGIESYTIASRLRQWENGQQLLSPSSKDVVVIDEAGMIGSRQMAKLMSFIDYSGAKAVLVGDPEQLQAINAGAAYRAISEKVGVFELHDIRRQKATWQQEATRDFAQQRTGDALFAYIQHDCIHEFQTQAQAVNCLLEQWDEVRQQAPEKSRIMLAYTRKTVDELNQKARDCRHAQGELGQDVLLTTERGKKAFAKNDQIYFLRNEYQALGVKNGSLGVIECIEENRLTVRLETQGKDEVRQVSFDLNDYNSIDHGYAATVYKAQGVTVDHAYVLASRHFDRHSTYVAMSRHREEVDVFYGRDEFPCFASLVKGLSRSQRKDVTLDYFHADGREKTLREQVNDALGYKESPERDDGFLGRGDFRTFKREFEERYPERAKELARAILPRAEREDLEQTERAAVKVGREMEKHHVPSVEKKSKVKELEFTL